MTDVLKLWPLLTATHRYDKSISTRNRGQGTLIDAPILAFLIETRQGRVLFDVGCDYAKLSDPQLRARWFDPVEFPMGPPEMTEEQRLPAHLARHGLSPADIDLVFLSHLHFDHAGGLCELCGCEVHVHEVELAAAAPKRTTSTSPMTLPASITGSCSTTSTSCCPDCAPLIHQGTPLATCRC